MLLTKKVTDSLDEHIITLDQLKKLKEGYSDQFQLDYNMLMRLFEQNKTIQGSISKQVNFDP
jgi:hypothetical protein